MKPQGWLLKQETIQAKGLTGHLDEFWNDVGPNSGWLGGTGESWERGPYYLDGLLPLAYQLNDKRLIEKAKRWVEWTLASQQSNGQFGPRKERRLVAQDGDAQGTGAVCRGDWGSACGALHEQVFSLRAGGAAAPALDEIGESIAGRTTSIPSFGSTIGPAKRVCCNLRDCCTIRDTTGKPSSPTSNSQSKETRDKLGLVDKGPIPDIAMQTHGVNNAMALKAAPIWWLVSGQTKDRAALYEQLHALDTYHGLPNGMFSGDEHFAGPDPSQGIELCAVVESMFSYETAFAILGDARLADRLERVTYNALPATLSNDMWSHQYDQQPNQIACTRAHRQWSTNGDDSNLFGLEPNFGCCTANLHQGWPKFVSSLWMASKDGGLVVTAYAPSEVKTAVRGGEVILREETEYPFRNTVRLTVIADGARQFPLLLRLPGWAKSATITVNGEA